MINNQYKQSQDHRQLSEWSNEKTIEVLDNLEQEENKKMNNETNEMELGIGTKEIQKLEAAKVKVIDVKIEPVTINGKESKKVQVISKHPGREEAIAISSVKYQKGDKLTESGLWFNKDEDGLIPKGSALAILLKSVESDNLEGIKGKEVQTIIDSKGYLTFKAY